VTGCALLLAFCCGSMGARAEVLPPSEDRLALEIDGAAPVSQRHVRYQANGAICETISWDGRELFGEVSHCEAVGNDHYWRRGMIDADLLLTRFAFLTDFLLAPPQVHREIVTTIGAIDLIAFQLEDVPGQVSGCNGFVRGFEATAGGYQAYVIGYVCTDRAALDDARADVVLRGLSVRGAFPSLLP
jgi:hypothetical protein